MSTSGKVSRTFRTEHVEDLNVFICRIFGVRAWFLLVWEYRCVGSPSAQACSAQDQLTLSLAALSSDVSRNSRDSLHCSSGYSTQTTTPSCSEDTIHSHGRTSPASLRRLPVKTLETNGKCDESN